MLRYNNTLDKILAYIGKNYTPCVRTSIDTMRDISTTTKAGVFNQVASVKENLNKYTKRNVNQAKRAQRFQVMFNNISTKKLIQIVNNNMVKGLPIKIQDVKLAEEIYGPNIYAL